MREYMTRDERLRRIGELLLKGVYLWAEACAVSEAPEASLDQQNAAVYGRPRPNGAHRAGGVDTIAQSLGYTDQVVGNPRGDERAAGHGRHTPKWPGLNTTIVVESSNESEPRPAAGRGGSDRQAD